MTSPTTATPTPVRSLSGSPLSGPVLLPPLTPMTTPSLVTPAMIYAAAFARTQFQLQQQEAVRAYWRAVALSN